MRLLSAVTVYAESFYVTAIIQYLPLYATQTRTLKSVKVSSSCPVGGWSLMPTLRRRPSRRIHSSSIYSSCEASVKTYILLWCSYTDTLQTCDPDDFTGPNGWSLRATNYSRTTDLLVAIVRCIFSASLSLVLTDYQTYYNEVSTVILFSFSGIGC